MNYGGIPSKYCNLDKAEIVILPVPYDATSTWIKGADKGPEAIIDASKNMELYDIETDSEVYKHGIFTDGPIDFNHTPEELKTVVKDKVTEFIGKDKFVVLLGGEHSVSIGSIESHLENYKGMCVLQLDAHADLRDEYDYSRFNHACVMARAKELCPIIQVGIRSMDISEKDILNKKNVFFAEYINNNEGWIKEVISKLSDTVYITIDLDVFDPSIMPSTGTPEPGGLLWYDVLSLLKEVTKQKKVIGFDVVELCPDENNKAPDFLAAKLIYKLLSYIFRGNKNG